MISKIAEHNLLHIAVVLIVYEVVLLLLRRILAGVTVPRLRWPLRPRKLVCLSCNRVHVGGRWILSKQDAAHLVVHHGFEDRQCPICLASYELLRRSQFNRLAQVFEWQPSREI